MEEGGGALTHALSLSLDQLAFGPGRNFAGWDWEEEKGRGGISSLSSFCMQWRRCMEGEEGKGRAADFGGFSKKKTGRKMNSPFCLPSFLFPFAARQKNALLSNERTA